MLTCIRRPYLEIETGNLHIPYSSHTLHLNGLSKKWNDVKYFDEKERNQIDDQLGKLISALSSRITELETLEKSEAYSTLVSTPNANTRKN